MSRQKELRCVSKALCLEALLNARSPGSRQSTPPMRLSLTALLPSDAGFLLDVPPRID